MPFFRKKSAKQSKEQPQNGPSNSHKSGKPVVPPHTPESPNADIGLPFSQLHDGSTSKQRVTLLPLHRSPSTNDSYLDMGDLGHPSVSSGNPRGSSRLSKAINEVINDKNALPCFIQYLETRDAVHFIKFYVDAESFQAASWTRIRSHSMTTVSKTSVCNSSTGDLTTATETVPATTDTLSNNAIGPLKNDPKRSVQTGMGLNSSNATTLQPSHNYSSDCNKNDVQRESTRLHPSNGAIENKLCKNLDTKDRQSLYMDTSQEDKFSQRLRQSIERDAVSIYSKYIALDCSHSIGISEELRNSAIHKICREDGQVDPLCFVDCQKFVLDVMDREYFQDFLRSEYYCKHIIDILTSGKVYLADILYNDTAMFYFTEYMEQEGAMDLILFWLAVDNFQQHLVDIGAKYDPVEAQMDAMVLYDKYFSLQASDPLGFEDNLRYQVESNICREGGPLPDCFVDAKKIVLNTIDQVYFKQFLQNEMYYKYLSEMVNTAQNMSEYPQTRRKREGSFDSDSHSISSQSTESESAKKAAENEAVRNTLLASDSASNPLIKKVVDKLNDDMKMDDFMFSDAPLWKRDQAGKMSFGRVNEFGQFESEIAPGPELDKKKGSRFFKKNKEKDKAQEDMAWRIAQTVINDVTSITLQTNDEATNTNAASSAT